MSDRPPIATTLHALRKRAGLTQSNLAAKVGGTQRRITNIERGTRRPSLELVEAWASACGRRFVVDFPLDGEADGELLAKLAAASPELRRVITDILGADHPSDAAVRALEGHVAAWRAHAAACARR